MAELNDRGDRRFSTTTPYVFLAVVLVPLKIAVIRFCRDREGEAGAILSIPEDLCYVAVGLILSDLLNATGALHQYFRSSRHPSIDIAVVVGLNVAFALVVHLLSQPTLRSYKNWRGADAARVCETPVQGELGFVTAVADTDTMHLIAHHLSAVALLYLLQLLLVIGWLHWLSKIIANVQN